MIKADLRNLDGTVINLELPENCSEIKYRAKLDFDDACLRMLNYLADHGDVFNTGYYLYLLSRALSDFFTAQNTPSDVKNPNIYKIDFSDLFNVDVSSLVDDVGELLPEVLEAHIESFRDKDEVDLETSEITLTKIFEHIYAIINNYEYDARKSDYSFVYKGETFKVFKRYRDTMYGFQTYEKVSLGELAEAFEVTRQTQKLFKKTDDKSSVNLTEILHFLAILARKDGEVFPMTNTENFIDSRSKFFLDIDFQSGSDVFFYLTLSLSLSQKEQIVSGSLTHLREGMQAHQTITQDSLSKITETLGSGQALTL